MNGFLPGDGTFPDPIEDIPVPETPPVDFTQIGKALADGSHQKWAELLKDVQCGTGTGPGQSQTWGDIINGIWKGNFLFCWFQKAVAWVMATAFQTLTWIIQQIFQVFDSAGGAMNQLFAATIYGLFGINASLSKSAATGLPTQGDTVAPQIASKIASALAAGTTTSGPGGIAPSSAGADKFMQMAAHMAIEGWMLGWITDALSVHELEQIGDLKDTLERTLGVGRLARRALHAPMKIFVETPYEQLLNQTYLPTGLDKGELVRYYLRGGIDRAGLQAKMNVHGYSSSNVDQLIYDQVKTLSMPEIVELIAAGTFSTDEAITALKHQGYDTATAPLVLQVATKNRVDQWARKGCEEALSLYREGKITRTRYDYVVNNSRLASDEQSAWHGYADIIDYENEVPPKKKPKRADLGEGLKLLERGIWTLPQYEQLLNYYNYIPSDEFDLAQLASDEAVDWQTLQQQKADALAARQKREADRLRKAQMMVEDIGVSTGEMETLVYEGLRSLGQYQQYLRNKSVAEDNIQTLSQALVIKLAQKTAAAAAKAAAQNKAKSKGVDLAQLETAVKQGILDLPTFMARVKALGMSDADAQLIETELQNSISAAAAKTQAAAAAKAKAAEKHIDLSQEERAVRLGILQMSDYAQFLAAHGYTPEEQGVLESALQDQLATDKATAAKKAAAVPKAAAKGINLTQLERLVRAGVKTVADYTAALATAGYDAADQAALTQYLQLQMQQDQQDLIVHGHAAALVDQMGVSLADLERAVKLSVVPIATYTDALQRAGVSSADQQTLTSNLAAQIKTTRAQQTTAQSVSKLVAAAGVSLATLEKDTLAGKLSIEQFQGLLAGYNVPADQVTDTVQLVQDMIDNKKAVDALVAQATARAAAKGLSLAQDTAAYKQQVMTEEEWRSRVAALGYDAADVEILFETLAATQAAAAAKSASKSGTTSTTDAGAPAAPATAVNGTTPTPTG